MAQQLGFNLSPDEFYRRFFSQQQITTGKPARADEVGAMIGAINQANQSYELPRQEMQYRRDSLAQQNQQFQQDLSYRNKALPSPSQAWISGAGALLQGGGTSALGYAALKQQGLIGGGKVAGAVGTGQQVLSGAGALGVEGTYASEGMTEGMFAGDFGETVASGSAGAGAMSYLPPVAGGVIGGQLGAMGGRAAGEALGIGGERERSIGGGIVGGAAAGAMVGGPVGAVIGGIVGGVSQLFGGDGGCIIVSCCHGRDSEEVNITREYRDKFMDKESIRGYYRLADVVVPQMEADPMFKKWVKREIVDNLIEYGKRELGYSDKCGLDAEAVSMAFLQACKDAGAGLESYTRNNGEVV
jgi:hypothetical protein